MAIDPNFGYETIGTFGDAIMNDHIRGSVFTIIEAGTADSITVALSRDEAGSKKVKCAIYKHSDLSLVGVTEERTLDLTDNFVWYTFNFAAPKPSLTANTKYVLAVWCDNAVIISIPFDYGANQGHYKYLVYTGSFPDPLTPAHADSKYSIYCTYTPTVPPPSPPGPQPAGRGTVNVYAVADSEEVTASVQIVETGKTYNTSFSEYLEEDTYTIRATYNGQTLTWNPTIMAGQTYEKTFSFTKMHDVTITSEPSPIDFTLNGEKQSTPLSQPLPSGIYTIIFPSSWIVGVDEHIFVQWENGSVNHHRTVTLGSPEAVNLIATYRLKQIDEAGPLNQLQHKDNLRQVFGDEHDLSEDNPLPVNVVEGGITLPDPLPTEDTGKNTNPEKWLHDNHWDNGAELILNAAVAVNLGAPVAAGATRRVRSITVRNTAQTNTVITLSQVAPAQNRVSFDVPAQTTRVWSEQDAVEFLAGVQVQIASSAAAVGTETYIHASGVEV